MAESVGGGKWEKYTDNEPIDLERSATEITVEKRVREDGRMEVRAEFPNGPSPLYFGPPFTFDSSGFILFLFFLFSFSFPFFHLILGTGGERWLFCHLNSFFDFVGLKDQTFAFSFNHSLFLFLFSFFRMSWSFKLARNDCWMCGLVPIGKKDYRGPLNRQFLICLEEEKEAFVVTPNYEYMSGQRRNILIEREMDFYGKEIEVCFLNIFFSLSLFFGSIFFNFCNYLF